VEEEASEVVAPIGVGTGDLKMVQVITADGEISADTVRASKKAESTIPGESLPDNTMSYQPMPPHSIAHEQTPEPEVHPLPKPPLEAWVDPKGKQSSAAPRVQTSTPTNSKVDETTMAEIKALDSYLVGFVGDDLNSLGSCRYLIDSTVESSSTSPLPPLASPTASETGKGSPSKSKSVSGQSATPRLPRVDAKGQTPDKLGEVPRRRILIEDRLTRLDQCVKLAEKTERKQKEFAAVYGVQSWKNKEWKGPQRNSQSASPRKPSVRDKKHHGPFTAR
jgi:hypothetical protein